MNDVEKCFDALLAQECTNTLYEYGLNNDKLVVLHKETRNAIFAIKIPSGMTNREHIENISMQRTVFESLVYITVVNKLAKIFYCDKNLLNKYKKKAYQCLAWWKTY